jgi:hypothetical protein
VAIRLAFSVTFAIPPFPETVVMPINLRAGFFAAKIIASASSCPGSQSSISGIGFIAKE